MRIHAALVSRGAYKQIIGALIYSKKYINIPWSSIRAKRGRKSDISTWCGAGIVDYDDMGDWLGRDTKKG